MWKYLILQAIKSNQSPCLTLGTKKIFHRKLDNENVTDTVLYWKKKKNKMLQRINDERKSDKILIIEKGVLL